MGGKKSQGLWIRDDFGWYRTVFWNPKLLGSCWWLLWCFLAGCHEKWRQPVGRFGHTYHSYCLKNFKSMKNPDPARITPMLPDAIGWGKSQGLFLQLPFRELQIVVVFEESVAWFFARIPSGQLARFFFQWLRDLSLFLYVCCVFVYCVVFLIIVDLKRQSRSVSIVPLLLIHTVSTQPQLHLQSPHGGSLFTMPSCRFASSHSRKSWSSGRKNWSMICNLILGLKNNQMCFTGSRQLV